MAIDNPLEQELQQVQKVYELLTDFFVNYSMQVIGAVIILVLGYYVSRSVSRWVTGFLVRKNVDITLSELLGNITYFSVLFCFVIISLGKFGISITPFVAALGAFSLGAGLAIQGVVGNYGAGLSIIFARPFVVGNTLTVQGVSGVVEQIRLAYTTLITEDGERITIPNREIIGQILENSYEHKLVETIVSIDIENDHAEAIEVLNRAVGVLHCVADEPGRQVGIDEFSDHAIRVGIRVWVATANYYQHKYEVNGAIYSALKDAGIGLCVPRQTIRVLA